MPQIPVLKLEFLIVRVLIAVIDEVLVPRSGRGGKTVAFWRYQASGLPSAVDTLMGGDVAGGKVLAGAAAAAAAITHHRLNVICAIELRV